MRASFIINTCLALVIAGATNAQEFAVTPARSGIWVNLAAPAFGGNIAIFRNGQEIAALSRPRSFEDFKAGYIAALPHVKGESGADDELLQAVWLKYRTTNTADSLGMWATDLPVRAGLGLAYFDQTASASESYSYTLNDARGAGKAAKFPPADNSIGALRPALIQPTQNGVYLEFEITDKGSMRSVNVYRAYRFRTKPVLITPPVSYVAHDNRFYATFTDLTATPRVAYDYVLMPVDAAGNEGTPSAAASLFNAPAYTIPPSVRHLDAVSDDAEKAIRLSWLPAVTPDVVSIEVYRGDTREGVYKKIASLSPHDTVYYDYDVAPVQTKYYTVAINGTYEKSVNTPRVPGTLRAVLPNYLPPQQLTATAEGRTVLLQWSRTEDDTHGYFVYRGTGYTGGLRKITPIILADGKMASYRDTLPAATAATVYTYAITDENTSYNESGLSERASIQYLPAANAHALPIAQVRVVPAEDGKLQVIWSNLADADVMVSSYTLYRTVMDNNGKVIEARKPLAAKLSRNIYFDGAVAAGNTYQYTVAVNGINGEAGSESLPAGYTIQKPQPLQVNSVRAMTGDDGVSLSWSNPQGAAISKVHILRAASGSKAKEIMTVDAATDTYTDKGVKKGDIYNYYFVTEGADSAMSEPTIPVTASIPE